MSAKIYDINTVLLIIGGVAISGGYAEDGGIEMEWNDVLLEPTVGAGGESAYSRKGNNNAKITITLMETSVAYRNLAILMEAQIQLIDLGLPVVPLNYQMIDPRSLDTVGANYVMFMERPQVNKGGTVGERVFVLDLVKPTVIYGASNVV